MDAVNNRKKLIIDVGVLHHEKVKALDGNLFRTLFYITSHTGITGISTPTIREMADAMGIADRTVQTHIKKLTDLGVLKTVRIKESSQYYTTGYVLDESLGVQLSIGGEIIGKPVLPKEDEAEDVKGYDLGTLTSKDVLTYFLSKYHETYGVEMGLTNNDWLRFTSIIKNKVINKYDAKLIMKAIDVLFREYDRKWKNPSFRRPTPFNLGNWIFDSCIAIVQDEELEAKRVKEQIQKGKEDLERLEDLESDEDILQALSGKGLKRS